MKPTLHAWLREPDFQAEAEYDRVTAPALAIYRAAVAKANAECGRSVAAAKAERKRKTVAAARAKAATGATGQQVVEE